MNALQKSGGAAALYMAMSHLLGIIIFLGILDYIHITDPAQKVALNVDRQTIVFSTNVLMYLFFGFALIILSLALYDQMKLSAPTLMQVGTAVALIWAGSLIASGMVANAALSAIAWLHAKDPGQSVRLASRRVSQGDNDSRIACGHGRHSHHPPHPCQLHRHLWAGADRLVHRAGSRAFAS